MIAAATAPSAPGAPFVGAWAAWRSARAVTIRRVASATYVRVAVPPAIAPGANRDYDDLRVVDDAQSEVPYVLTLDAPETQRTLARLGAARMTGDSDQRWMVDTGDPTVTVSAIGFAGTAASFERRVHIEASPDGSAWLPVADDHISCFPNAGCRSRLAFPVQRGRYWRVVVSNGDDRPIGTLHPTLYGPGAEIVFRATPPRSYRVLYGNADAAPPTYDLGSRLAHEPWHAIPAALSDDIRTNATPPLPPWYRRNEILAGVAFTIIVTALAGLAISMLRGRTPSEAQ